MEIVTVRFTLQAEPFFHLLHLRVRSLLSMRGMLLGYSFEHRPNSRVLATAGSVITIGLLINGCSHLKKEWVWRERTRLTILRRPQRFDVIQAELPFLLLTQEDKTKLYSQGELGFTCDWRSRNDIFVWIFFALSASLWYQFHCS